MLTKRRCPATGAINFYSRQEPFIAVGTVIPSGEPVRYVWHYHGGATPAAGLAYDWRAVELAIGEHHRRARDHAVRCAA